MYWRSSGPNASSRYRRCPTIGKFRRIARRRCMRSYPTTPPNAAAAARIPALRDTVTFFQRLSAQAPITIGSSPHRCGGKAAPLRRQRPSQIVRQAGPAPGRRLARADADRNQAARRFPLSSRGNNWRQFGRNTCSARRPASAKPTTRRLLYLRERERGRSSTWLPRWTTTRCAKPGSSHRSSRLAMQQSASRVPLLSSSSHARANDVSAALTNRRPRQRHARGGRRLLL